VPVRKGPCQTVAPGARDTQRTLPGVRPRHRSHPATVLQDAHAPGQGRTLETQELRQGAKRDRPCLRQRRQHRELGGAEPVRAEMLVEVASQEARVPPGGEARAFPGRQQELGRDDCGIHGISVYTRIVGRNPLMPRFQ
jgi:hypothetical protein